MDYPILRYVDVLIGFAGVMLLAATVVTAVTHLFVSTFYFRSRQLRMGLTDMIRQIDPAVLTQDDAQYLAELILRHPLYGRPISRLGRLSNFLHNEWRVRLQQRDPLPSTDPADIIQRSELMIAILELAAGQGPLLQGAEHLPTEASDRIQGLNFKLRKALANNGLDDPKSTLQAVRLAAVDQERSRPDQPAHQWWNRALLDQAGSEFISKIAFSFDSTMDRVARNFKLKANSLATATAALVVFTVQLDSVALLSRLNSDDRFRDSLVRESEMWGKRYEDARAALDVPAAPAPVAAAPAPAVQPAPEPRIVRGKRGKRRAPEVRNEPKLMVIEPAPAPAAQAAPAPPPAPTKQEISEKEQREEDLRRARTARREIDEALEQLRQPRYAIIPDKMAILDAGVFWKPGVWLSWVLLSLGAPLWFNVLKNVLRMRSMLAQRDDGERADRLQERPNFSEEVEVKTRGASAG